MRRPGSPGTRRPGSGREESACRRREGAGGASWLPIVVGRRGSSTVCFGLALALVLPGIAPDRGHAGIVVPCGLALDRADVSAPRGPDGRDRLDVAGSPAYRPSTWLHGAPPRRVVLARIARSGRLARSCPGGMDPTPRDADANAAESYTPEPRRDRLPGHPRPRAARLRAATLPRDGRLLELRDLVLDHLGPHRRRAALRLWTQVRRTDRQLGGLAARQRADTLR